MTDLTELRAAMGRLAAALDRNDEDAATYDDNGVLKVDCTLLEADLRACAEVERMLEESSKALRAMIDSHGAHGPCVRNGCRDCRRAYDLATKALTSHGGASAHSDVVFLLERGQALGHAPTVWWKGPGQFDFTETAHEARQFHSKPDAEKWIRDLEGPAPKFPFALITEHVFLHHRPTDQAAVRGEIEQRCGCGDSRVYPIGPHATEETRLRCALEARTRELARDRAIAEAAREWYAMLCDDKTTARQRWEAEGRLVDRILEQTP